MAELRYVDWDGLVYYDGKVKQYIDDKIEDCLKVGGIVTGETLPSPSFRNLNYIYKITDEFTADENFEASLRGYIYDPGTWVQVTDINHVYLYTIFMEANASASDYEKLEEAITAIQAELTRLDSGLNETSRRVASLDQSTGETAVKVSELESSLTVLNDKVDSKADIDTVQAHYETNELKFNNLTSQVSANTSSISTLSASVLSSQTTLSNLDSRLDSIEPEVEKIKGFENEINSLDDRIETIDDNVSTLINSSSTIITKVEALEDKVSDNETAIETLTTSANELDERVEALESRPESDLSQFALKSEIPTVPTNISEFNNDAGYLTEHQSLEGYAKVTDIPDVSKFITEVPTEYVTETELTSALNDYAKSSELEEVQQVAGSNSVKLFAIESDLVDISAKVETIPSIEGLATEEFVTEAINNIEYPTTDLSNYYTKSEVDTKFENIDYPDTDLTGYATETFVHEMIAKAELEDKEADLEAYYTKEQVDALIPDVEGFLTEIPEEYITETELNSKGFLTEHQNLDHKADIDHKHNISEIEGYSEPDLSDYALKSDIPEATDLSDYYNKEATEGLIDEAIAGIQIPDVSNFISMSDVEAKGYITEDALISYATTDSITSTLEDYYTKDEVNNHMPKATSHLTNDSGFVTEEDVQRIVENTPSGTDEATVKQIVESYSYVNEESLESALEEASSSIIGKVEEKNYLVESDLNGYAKTEAIPTIPTNVSAFVNDAKYLTEVPEGYVKEETLSNYYNKTEIDNLIPSTEGFITEIPEEYVTEGELQEAIAGIQIPDISLDGYATQEWVKDQGYLTTHQDLSGKADVEHTHEEYALKTELPDVTGFIKEIPEEYITETDLNDYGFITDVSDKADKDHKHTLADITDYEAPVIPDVSNFVTSDDVESAIENKQDKLVSGTNIATINGKSLLDGGNIEIAGGTISSPDDIILNFTDPTINAIGGIAAGTVITNWSLTKLIQTMLFGQPSTPDEPEYETPAEKIIAEETPMYNMDANGNLIEVPFALRTLDETAAAAGPVDLDGTEDGFYQITDSNGEVVESGYQTTSCTGAESPYILALPKDISITDGKVEYWDLLNNTWYSDPDYKFSTDLSMLVDYEIMSQEDVNQLVAQYDALGYNVWIQNEPEEPPTGKVFRFII